MGGRKNRGRGSAQGWEGMIAEKLYEQAWTELLEGRRVSLPTSLCAKSRLKEVVAADRAAVPCGRWVRVEVDLFERVFWLNAAKPRCRWSERR